MSDAIARLPRLARAPEGAEPWIAIETAAGLAPGQRLLWIARDDAQAAVLAEALAFVAPSLRFLSLPAWDCLPYDRIGPRPAAIAERWTALSALADPHDPPALVITTVAAVLQRVLSPARVRAQVESLAVGDAIDRDRLAAKLTGMGYVRVDTVTDVGEYAVRGGLIDVFVPGEPLPVRIDMFGDDIESIRPFDPAEQISQGARERVLLLPATEVLLTPESVRRFRQGYVGLFGAPSTSDMLYQAISEGRPSAGYEHWLPLFEDDLATLFDYLGEAPRIVLANGVAGAVSARLDHIADYYQARVAATGSTDRSQIYHPLPPELLYLTAAELAARLDRGDAMLLEPFASPQATARDWGGEPARDFAPERADPARSVYDALREELGHAAKAGRRPLIACYSAGSLDRLGAVLVDHGLSGITPCATWQEVRQLGHDRIGMAVLGIERGFRTASLEVLTEQDILGDRLVRKSRRSRRADHFLTEVTGLTPGDLIVHADHGIGRFEGLRTITVSNAPHDCVALTYADGDRLFVPVENIDVLTRYGAANDNTPLDKLGGVAWQQRKARMKERIRAIAHTLIRTAAARQLREAPVMERPAGVYEEFCARFPYVETDDQARAVDDVLGDLAAGRPMDRLVCGDVGFGKTEVALRAACVAAMAGMQVAVICPTTLLARQHHATFTARFQGLPIRIGRLSRMVPAAEAKATREGIGDGGLDIVIGTHALLAKGIAFKRLGLVIIDEEQHFGVTHKERLKQLKADVHVLTLTATPIPRTLQMAMSGLKDLSVIATPPIDRLAVRTYVSPWDPVVLREALLREHSRGGQSFFVCPRIADLPDLETFLREQVPEVRTIVAHGQMAPTELEDRMTAFCEQRYDVLLSTTIVESGLDIPTANTLVVHRADQFGLPQLYQLRGRIGRSKHRAYAYFTHAPGKPLTEPAEKRLHVLSSLDGLGAGFTLASHDLDLRGAGNLLGDEQSGHIREVGFELYQQMLEDAMIMARAQGTDDGEAPVADALAPQISLGASVLIPETYVPDLGVRLGLYRRLGELDSKADIDAFGAELIDRFGPLPTEAANLLQVMEIKLACRKAGIARLEAGARGAVIGFHNDRFDNPAGLVAFLTDPARRGRLRPDNKVVVAGNWERPAQRLGGALAIARALARLVS